MNIIDNPEYCQAAIDRAMGVVADAGGVPTLVAAACEAWVYVNDNMQVNPANLSREELEQAYTKAMHAAWVLARLNIAVNGSLLHGGDARSRNAAKGGKGKLDKNAIAKAKADAKAEALKLWIERHAGKHPKLGTVEQFATEVMRRWPILESSKVICGWSAKWTKQVRTGATPAC